MIPCDQMGGYQPEFTITLNNFCNKGENFEKFIDNVIKSWQLIYFGLRNSIFNFTNCTWNIKL